jgi:hypothetical protein
MAGFGRVSFEGEFQGQQVVNVLHYRSTEWLPLGGNPFDDVANFLATISTALVPSFLDCMSDGYKLNTLTGIGYDDTFHVVTPSPLVLTENEFGTGFTGATQGAAGCAIVSWRCGPQVQINNIGTSKRNRGYMAIGPQNDASVDDLSHISGALFTKLEAFAAAVQSPLTNLLPPCTLTPIVLHEKYTTVLGVRVLTWRTYSDIMGFAVRRVASFRRSRRPEA